MINKQWSMILKEELEKPYLTQLRKFIEAERKTHAVYPPENLFFEALNQTPFQDISVVILGQDPYHQAGQANGLAFSVGHDTPIPPSLRNIYKELEQDIENFEVPNHGDLSSWARQGVFLLNTTLSVRDSAAGSHQKKGWEEFTDVIIQKISDQKTDVVFMLWGNLAKGKMNLIDDTKHHILCTSHPSPLSSYRGFLGSKIFSKTNDYLMAQRKEPIDWRLPKLS